MPAGNDKQLTNLFHFEHSHLHWHGVALPPLVQDIYKYLQIEYHYEGPFYLYHTDIFKKRLYALDQALPNARFFYSVKSLSNLAILKHLHEHSYIGLDVVSGGEIERALRAGFSPQELVFAGVGKTEAELIWALQLGIHCFHVESLSELSRIDSLSAQMGRKAFIGLRINPEIEVETHAYIQTGSKGDKFGLALSEVDKALEIIAQSPMLHYRAVQAHIGSQLRESRPYLKTLEMLSKIARVAEDYVEEPTEYISLGGGFAIDYDDTQNLWGTNEFSIKQLNEALQSSDLWSGAIAFEPGRYVAAPAGALIMQVLYIKDRDSQCMAVTNAGMNDFLRPPLYNAEHTFLPLHNRDEKQYYDIVGPVCESADAFAQNQKLSTLHERDYLVATHAGAYGAVMSSNYNSRPLVPEILIDSNGWYLARAPQSFSEMLSKEELDPPLRKVY